MSIVEAVIDGRSSRGLGRHSRAGTWSSWWEKRSKGWRSADLDREIVKESKGARDL